MCWKNYIDGVQVLISNPNSKNVCEGTESLQVSKETKQWSENEIKKTQGIDIAIAGGQGSSWLIWA